MSTLISSTKKNNDDDVIEQAFGNGNNMQMIIIASIVAGTLFFASVGIVAIRRKRGKGNKISAFTVQNLNSGFFKSRSGFFGRNRV